jgi:hypothetical protein
MAAGSRASRSRTPTGRRWESYDDDRLLALKLSGLDLSLRHSPIWTDIEKLYRDLERRQIGFRPHVWISSEWFSPDGIPGIAVPFFVVNPRLRRLERQLMGEVEGGNAIWRQRILRHEAGHAIDTAYGLRRRADWRAVFGYASKPYPRDYSVRPGSTRYVLHLGHWYAQSHPTEDFAETFAVWLQPKARWRRDYAGWPALRKLEFVDALMQEIAGRPPRTRDRSLIAPLSEMTETLGRHYRRKLRAYDPSERRYDAWLQRTFAKREKRPRGAPAGRYIKENASRLRRALVRHLAVNPYLADHVIERLRERSRRLGLVLRGSRKDSLRAVLSLHERVAFDVLRRNRENYLL